MKISTFILSVFYLSGVTTERVLRDADNLDQVYNDLKLFGLVPEDNNDGSIGCPDLRHSVN